MLIYTLCVSGLEGRGGGRRGGGASDCTGVWRVGLSVLNETRDKLAKLLKTSDAALFWKGADLKWERKYLRDSWGMWTHGQFWKRWWRWLWWGWGASSWLRVNRNFPVFWICMLCSWRQTNRRTDGGTDVQMKGRRDGRRIKHSDDITGIGIEMGWDLREDGSPQDACSITTRCM